HLGLVLAATGRFIDAELDAERRAVGGIALCVHPGAAAVLVVGAPGHDEAAALEHRHRRFVLRAGGRGVDAELAAGGRAIGGVALRVDPPAAAVLAVRSPRRDEAAVVGRDRGQLLLAAGGGIHALLAAERDAKRRVALHVDAVAAAIQAALVGPQDHEAAV